MAPPGSKRWLPRGNFEPPGPACGLGRNSFRFAMFTSGQSGPPGACNTAPMKDLREKLEKLRVDAEDCRLISRLAADKAKRELFARLAEQLLQMAADIEAAIAAKIAGGET